MNDQINNSINGVIYCYIRLSCFLICFSELSHCCCKKKEKKGNKWQCCKFKDYAKFHCFKKVQQNGNNLIKLRG